MSPPVSPGHHHRLVFGAPLTSSAQIVLLQIMAHVEAFAGLEGIFRKSGSKLRVDQLVQQLREKEFEEILLSGYYKPHDYTSMLKKFLSELPEPLFLKRHLGAYMQTSGIIISICLKLYGMLAPLTCANQRKFHLAS